MKKLIALFTLIFLAASAQAQDFASGGSAEGKKGMYNLGAEVQIGYPSVKLKNPDDTDAIYDGIAVRAGLNIPILKSKSFDIYLSPNVKYIDLENLANSSNQYEAANLIGAGAGLSFRFNKLWFGGRYMHIWGRHHSSGAFDDRSDYQMGTFEGFAGVYFQFDRLGLGLSYNRAMANIPKDKTGLEADTAYDETIFSLQATFDMGASLWGILGSLF
jgi:hypothetical protein